MNQYLGMFYARDPRALQGVCDAPYHICGRHALCARQSAGDGGALALVCGRVRNARALREELSARGLKPQPGDSGLLLAAWRMWGEACVRRIEGAAQLIVIDQDARRLLLAADRMGEAGPLFYAAVHKSIVFANHPAPLLEAPGVARVIDQDGLRELFGLGPARTPGRTPLRDVFQLPPGHMLLADEDGHRVTRYFRLEARPHEDSPEKTVETVRALLDQALSEAAPLSPACMLSGGLDSTALTALLTQIRGEPARTFSVDYEENDRHFSGGSYQPEQDAPYVAEAVRALGCEHTRVVLPVRSLADALEDAVIARGFPGMADIDSSLMLFSREIAPSGRYVISGECGDEVFGGYPWFNREELICAEGFPWSGSLALRESVLNEPVRRALNLPAYVEGRYQEAVARQSLLPGEDFRAARLRLIQGLCFDFFMANLQERAFCMGSPCGLSVITPYCDERLAQYVFNVPWEMKRMLGVEKGLLRAAVRDLLPESLLMRRKSPYPKTYHPAYADAVRLRLRAILEDSHAPLNAVADRKMLLGLIESGLSPAETPWFGQLMAGPQMLAYLIQINLWMLYYKITIEIA